MGNGNASLSYACHENKDKKTKVGSYGYASDMDVPMTRWLYHPRQAVDPSRDKDGRVGVWTGGERSYSSPVRKSDKKRRVVTPHDVTGQLLNRTGFKA